MPTIKLPPSLANSKVDISVAKEIADEALDRPTKVFTDAGALLDDLDISLEATLLQINHLAQNAKESSVQLQANRTLLELRKLLGNNSSGQVNNGVVVVINDSKEHGEQYKEIFYPEQVQGRTIAHIDINKENNDNE